MVTYVIRRLLLMIPTLLGITMMVFFVAALSPGGTSAALATAQAGMKPQERKALENYLNERYGLNKPPVVQYLMWLRKVTPIGPKHMGEGWPGAWRFGFKAPDLGESFIRGRPVADLILESLPITLLLNGISFPIFYTLSIFTGLRAARRRGEAFDVGMGTFLLMLWSIPTIWAGVMLIGFLASKQYIHWFPTTGLHDIRAESMAFLPSFSPGGWQRGWLLDSLWHLALPVLCLTYGSFAFLSKLARGAILESLGADYVRTARAKGVSENGILYRHAFRNSLLPLITVAAQILPSLLAGSIIVEVIFSINGMGKLMVDAVNMRDRELVLSDALLAGLLGLVAYLIADIAYAVADPRISFD
jgi:peptide/nickel transport system permease protein